MDIKKEVVELLTTLLDVSKAYNTISREIFEKLEKLEKKDLHLLYQHDKDVKYLINKYEEIYLKIQKEI